MIKDPLNKGQQDIVHVPKYQSALEDNFSMKKMVLLQNNKFFCSVLDSIDYYYVRRRKNKRRIANQWYF